MLGVGAGNSPIFSASKKIQRWAAQSSGGPSWGASGGLSDIWYLTAVSFIFFEISVLSPNVSSSVGEGVFSAGGGDAGGVVVSGVGLGGDGAGEGAGTRDGAG